ncbi:MAG: phosphonate C-P lyase system protein PhnL [Neomegalonema sp.]|nr:phosphonate C-P lyase system protein PhnL [Neomegalonema sp.]
MATTRSEPDRTDGRGPVQIDISGLKKSFHLFGQNVSIPVMEGGELCVHAGECVALIGESGAGKSTLMRMIYGNYRSNGGKIRVRCVAQGGPEKWIDVGLPHPHEIIEMRRATLGYVSQFLRVIPRVSTLDIVAEPAIAAGAAPEEAVARAKQLLSRLRVRETLWGLSPLTFSGGEQQRVNIARGFAHRFPIMLLDEPTASLDAVNRETVLQLIEEARDDGAAIIGIFHDSAARARICSREIDVSAFTAQAA